MDKIHFKKAFEILNINLCEASKQMPPDVKLALNLAMDCFVCLDVERTVNGYTRIAQLPHEANRPNMS